MICKHDQNVLTQISLLCTGVFILADIVVLVLSSRVNVFQEFFFVADLFPLALSIITLVIFVTMYVLFWFFFWT